MTTPTVPNNLQDRYTHLKKIITAYKKVLVAYSGGVDSTFLLKVALDQLGPDNVLACIGLSDSVAKDDYDDACKIAKQMGAKLEIAHPNEMNNPNYLANPTNRCYFCKTELYSLLTDIAKQKNFNVVLSGTNADDASDYRPGRQAADEFKIESPLEQAHLTKQDIRILSRELNLETADKPAQPCLASRVTYGLSVTTDRLKQIENAEAFLKTKGLEILRVRHHDNLVRIEVPPEKIEQLSKNSLRNEIVTHFKSLGFTYITLDLQGFRSGSGNEPLNLTPVPKN
ncbi:MAG: ATP-dependent sacrificial sulfur transferase LarE [Planctomycetes bacterium]|nr:ATP-dependent sacrificial sulfur transferase LarE [Planctomycetota bacterium]